MRDLKGEAALWLRIANNAKETAVEKQDKYSDPAMQIAALCEHIAGAMERISHIMESVDYCMCGKCPAPVPQPLN